MMSEYLDETDFKILNLLQIDGELTYKEIAGKLNRSKSNIVERIKALKKNGVIDRHVVIIDPQKVRNIFTAFPHVQLKNHGQNAIENFKVEMEKYDEVRECYHVTGNFDFMLKIVTADMVAYNNFLRDNVASNPEVGTIQSFLVLSQSKVKTLYKF